jgi:hypothetical protein
MVGNGMTKVLGASCFFWECLTRVGRGGQPLLGTTTAFGRSGYVSLTVDDGRVAPDAIRPPAESS